MQKNLAFVFPGQGSQTVAMLADFAEHDIVQNTFKEASAALGYDLWQLIAEGPAEKLNMSMDQVVVTLDKHGNTSAATIPTALDEAIRDGRIKRGQTILMEAFGSGFTWGSALIKY